jgi:hypothetical protein
MLSKENASDWGDFFDILSFLWSNSLLLMKLFPLFGCCVLVFSACSKQAAADEPTADDIMRLVRMSYANQDYKLRGELRDDATGRKEAFELTMQQRLVRFRFSDPSEIVDLDLSVEPAVLSRVLPGKKESVPLAAYADAVRGMSMNYEDLSLRFTYWPRPQLMGTDTVKTARCWVVRVTNPDGRGPYGTVDLWVHQGSGGVAKMEAYDAKANLLKRFVVESVQKVNEVTLLKQMRIEAYEVGSKKARRTYMKMDRE